MYLRAESPCLVSSFTVYGGSRTSLSPYACPMEGLIMNDYYLATKWRERVERERAYTSGELPPNYPVPAIPMVVDYVFEYPKWGGNGIFIRERGWIVAGAYSDGQAI